jgi:hypothetical protein
VHPDRAPERDAERQARKFMEVREAYECLRSKGCPVPAAEQVVEEPAYFRRTAGRSFAPKGPDPLARERWASGQESSPWSWVLWCVVIPGGALGVVVFVRYLLSR